MGLPQNGWFIRRIPIKVDDLGVPPFMEPPLLLKKLSSQFLCLAPWLMRMLCED